MWDLEGNLQRLVFSHHGSFFVGSSTLAFKQTGFNEKKYLFLSLIDSYDKPLKHLTYHQDILTSRSDMPFLIKREWLTNDS